MNFNISDADSITEVIKKRISYFKEVHEKYEDSKTRSLCQVKISTLEMVLNDLYTLHSLKSDKSLL